MSFDKQFSAENTMMSVVGHLALVAVMITTFAVVVDHKLLVAPDRVQITEIDLSQIKITREETSLYNTAPAPADPEPQKPEDKKPDTKPEPEDFGDDEPIEKPTMVQPETPKTKMDDKKPEDANLPKKKTVVRVNREKRSLDRTMTISVVDALRVALTRCWVIDSTRPDITDIRAVAHLTMYKNGTVRDVWFESAARAESDPAFAYVVETIRGALTACQPFRMLPVSEFDHWEKIQLTFYPTRGTIM